MLRPSPGFVVKCTHQKKRAGTCKLFLNMVYSEEVGKPSTSETPSNDSTAIGDGRVKWSVPYAMSPLRMEHDKSSSLVPTFDCCFHPQSLQYAHKRKEFCDLIVSIAKEAAVKIFENSGDEIDMSPGYTIIKGIQYKSGTPKAMMISDGKVPDHEENCNCLLSSRQKKHHNVPTKAQNETSPTAPTVALNGVVERNEYAGDKDPLKVIPKHKIIEQGVFDIADHTVQNSEPMARKPKQLVVHVYLDKTTSASEIILDVSEKKLLIAPSTKSKQNYHLELTLPYPVDQRKGNAKFDRKKETMVVTLPVVP